MVTFVQPCAQLVDFVGHSAHNANNHRSNLPIIHVEQKFDNVTVVHDVLLALGALQALGLDGGIVEVGVLQVFVRDDLRTDEAALKVAVDLAGSLRGLGAAS